MSKLRHSAFMIALVGALSACAPNPAELFDDAETAFANADFQAARVSLITALEAQPDNVEMQVLLVRTLVALGNGEGAALRISALPDEIRNSPEMVLLLAEAEVLRGRFVEAIKVVEGREDAPSDRIRALAFIGQNQFEDAAAAFAAGAKRSPPDSRLLASYARFELGRDNVTRALELSNAATKLKPKEADGLLARAAVFLRQNDLPSSLDDFDAVQKAQPANFDARVGKALVLAKMGRSDESNALLGALKRDAPKSADVGFIEARISANEGDWQRVRTTLQKHEGAIRGNTEATELYSEALIALDVPGLALNFLRPELERRPNSRSLRLLLAKAQLAAGESGEASETIRILAGRPDANEAELDVAIAAAKASGKHATAETLASRKKTATPQWIGGELAKADKALRNRQWSAAERSYQAIVSRMGATNALVLNNLAFAQEKQGKLDVALKNALQAVQLEPDNASVLDTAGWLLVQKGAKERGVAMLTKAAKIAPGNKTVKRHLEDARGM